MATRYDSTVGTGLVLQAECEWCRHVYQFHAQVSASSGGKGFLLWGASSRAEAHINSLRNLKAYLNAILDGSIVPVTEIQACPRCGYIQSWNIGVAKNHIKEPGFITWIGITIMLILIAAVILMFVVERPCITFFTTQLRLLDQIFQTVVIAGVIALLILGAVAAVLLFVARKNFNPNKKILGERIPPSEKNTPNAVKIGELDSVEFLNSLDAQIRDLENKVPRSGKNTYL